MGKVDIPLESSKEENIAFLKAVEPLANVREVLYLPHWTRVDLEYGDGRVYSPKSLPGTVAGKRALYHHARDTFYKHMKDGTRAHRIDPSQDPLASMLQDDQNYLRNSSLSPGCPLECAFTEGGSVPTSAAVRLQRPDGKELLTTAHHGSSNLQEVFHPSTYGDKIGDIVDTRQELDIALIELNPAHSNRFTNTSYFQAEAPSMLLGSSDIKQGSWSEVDGMSSGLVTLLSYGRRYSKP